MKKTILDYRDGAVDSTAFFSATNPVPAAVPVSSCFRMRGASAITRRSARGAWRSSAW